MATQIDGRKRRMTYNASSSMTLRAGDIADSRNVLNNNGLPDHIYGYNSLVIVKDLEGQTILASSVPIETFKDDGTTETELVYSPFGVDVATKKFLDKENEDMKAVNDSINLKEVDIDLDID